jgi:hypothetical protein
MGWRRKYEASRAALAAAGLDESYGFHSPRHSYGTALAAQASRCAPSTDGLGTGTSNPRSATPTTARTPVRATSSSPPSRRYRSRYPPARAAANRPAERTHHGTPRRTPATSSGFESHPRSPISRGAQRAPLALRGDVGRRRFRCLRYLTARADRAVPRGPPLRRYVRLRRRGRSTARRHGSGPPGRVSAAAARASRGRAGRADESGPTATRAALLDRLRLLHRPFDRAVAPPAELGPPRGQRGDVARASRGRDRALQAEQLQVQGLALEGGGRPMGPRRTDGE